jgi:hypothetical protein
MARAGGGVVDASGQTVARPRRAAVRPPTGWAGAVLCGGGDYTARGGRPPCLEGERCGGVGHIRRMREVKEGREGQRGMENRHFFMEKPAATSVLGSARKGASGGSNALRRAFPLYN